MSKSLVTQLQKDLPIIMGILNTTPDSFSDGGKFLAIDAAVGHALQMLDEGAQIIDVGGESTRPGALDVSLPDELQRVIPVIESLVQQQSDVCISVDSSKPEVMAAAVKAGASLINDVNALRAPGALEVCAELNVPVCLMHMSGDPRSMQLNPQYSNVLEDIKSFLLRRVECCIAAGIKPQHIIIDPGFGFGKTLQHNLLLLNNLPVFQSMGFPVLVGLSRKSMFGALLDRPADQRLHASIAAVVLAWTKGAKIFRVHDVKATDDALKVCKAMQNAGEV